MSLHKARMLYSLRCVHGRWHTLLATHASTSSSPSTAMLSDDAYERKTHLHHSTKLNKVPVVDDVKQAIADVAKELNHEDDRAGRRETRNTLLSRLIAIEKEDNFKAPQQTLENVQEYLKAAVDDGASATQRSTAAGRRLAAEQEKKSERVKLHTRLLSEQEPVGVDLFNDKSIADADMVVKPLAAEDNKEVMADDMKVWNALAAKRQFQLDWSSGPQNGWDELALWTKQNKTWPYPIDNEYALPAETEVSFMEHVFVAQELEPLGFPKSGPVRQFMELVANGLSKNPYMTIDVKREHLRWFADYFDTSRMEQVNRFIEEEDAAKLRKEQDEA